MALINMPQQPTYFEQFLYKSRKVSLRISSPQPVMPKTNIYTTNNLKVDVVRKHNPTLSDMLPKANVRRIPTRYQAPATLLAIIFFIHNIPP